MRGLAWGVALIAVGYWASRLVAGAPASGAVGSSGVARPPAPSPLEGLADTLEQALGAYGTRVQFFENRQMTCDDLAQGLLALGDRWLRYSLGRRAEPDAIASSRDEALTAHVAGAERQFANSGCSRP